MVVNLKGRHFLTLRQFTADEIHYLLDLSKALKIKKLSGIKGRLLEGKNIVLLFEKASTRTRCAFEVAVHDEGGSVTFLSNSQIGKKESIEDSAKVLSRYYDGIEFRGFEQKTVEELAQHSKVPVWNGLTNLYHPTQILADFLTIKEHVHKPLNRVKLVFVGDARNNMGNSLMIGSAKMGIHFIGLAPKTLFPDPQLVKEMQEEAKKSGGKIEISDNIAQSVRDADVICTDVWCSMGEESLWAERIRLLKPYQVNMDMLRKTKNSDVKFMHCLPACHDTKTDIGKKIKEKYGISEMEVTDEVFCSNHSVVFDEAENRIPTTKAVMVSTIVKLPQQFPEFF